MELRALWKIVRRRWWLILLPSLAAFAYAAYGYMKAPPGGGFTTSIRFTAAEPPDSDAISYEDAELAPWLSSEYIVNALTDWARTNTYAQEVSDQLSTQGIEIPAPAIQGAIAADNVRAVMTLYLSWHDPDQLAALAEAATTVLVERSADYFPQFGDGGVDVVPLDTPGIAPVPPPVSARFDPLIRLGLGVAAGVALAFLVDYLDPTLRDRMEVERMGLPVLAEIPRVRGRQG